MAKSIFETLKDDFALAVETGKIQHNQHTPQALQWFYDYIRRNVTSMHALEGLRSGKRGKISPGSFFVYSYDPKWKKELPYYDTMPLILCTSVTPKGWYGINLHYIPPEIRLIIVKEMYKISKMTSNDNMKFKLSWQKAVQLGDSIGKTPYFKHAIKQYLGNHVKSNLIKIKGDNIEPMIFLPIARFHKQSMEYVWGDV